MINYNKELEEQLKELDKLIKINTKNLAKFKNLPEYSVKASTVRGCHQYYIVDKGTGNRKYAGKKQHKLIEKLIQRDYEVEVDKKLAKLRKKLDKFISSYDISEVDGLYANLPAAKKDIVEPIIEPNDILVQRWMDDNPGNQNTFPDKGIYKTNRGEMVRSKSEKIIADALEKYNIPYQYEPMLELGYNIVYPDFVILNMRTQKTLYWEHLGLLSDSEYAEKNFKKIQEYEKNGYILGRDLITTMEFLDMPIDVKIVEDKIKESLL